ncbi:oxidoreductase [Paenibacillus sp. GCM10023252]|uniref:oxidoreductase n=1 Tax=Paenibacillus sp. GCM10023252 TaxID=3252649 RepID=UPI003610150F
MKRINNIETKLSHRFNENDHERLSNKNIKFADIMIDGESLYHKLKKYDMIPALGWGSLEQQSLTLEYLLFKKPFELTYHRYPILICPECGDLECGFLSVSIDLEDDIVTWSNFMLEHDNVLIDLGPYYFHWDDYRRAIKKYH